MGWFGSKRKKEQNVKLGKKEALLKKKPLEIMKQLIEENSYSFSDDSIDGDLITGLATPSIEEHVMYDHWSALFYDAISYKEKAETYGDSERYVQSLAMIYNIINCKSDSQNDPPNDHELSVIWHTAGIVVNKIGCDIDGLFFHVANNISNNWESLYELGELRRSSFYDKDADYEEVWKLEEAIEYFDKALEIDSEQPDVWVAKIEVLTDLKKYEEANSCCDELLEYRFAANGIDYEITLLELLVDFINKQQIIDNRDDFSDLEELNEELSINKHWEKIVSTVKSTTDASMVDLHSLIDELASVPLKTKSDDDICTKCNCIEHPERYPKPDCRFDLGTFLNLKSEVLFELEKYDESLICVKAYSVGYSAGGGQFDWKFTYEKFKTNKQTKRCFENAQLTWHYWNIDISS
jgi:tetratricopeptide (TPR) repeat protein